MDTASAMSRVEVPKYPRWANSVDAASRMRPRVDDQSIGGGRQPSPYFTPLILSVEQRARLRLRGFHVDVVTRIEPLVEEEQPYYHCPRQQAQQKLQPQR